MNKCMCVFIQQIYAVTTVFHISLKELKTLSKACVQVNIQQQ